jgi:hypothetical protein
LREPQYFRMMRKTTPTTPIQESLRVDDDENDKDTDISFVKNFQDRINLFESLKHEEKQTKGQLFAVEGGIALTNNNIHGEDVSSLLLVPSSFYPYEKLELEGLFPYTKEWDDDDNDDDDNYDTHDYDKYDDDDDESNSYRDVIHQELQECIDKEIDDALHQAFEEEWNTEFENYITDHYRGIQQPHQDWYDELEQPSLFGKNHDLFLSFEESNHRPKNKIVTVADVNESIQRVIEDYSMGRLT